jgi:predicted lipid-binding transport protein (Tim44 family)
MPPTPSVIAVDASEADRVAAKTADVAMVDAYDQQVADFSAALSTYRDAQTAYTQCDVDARAAAILTASVLPQFAYEFMDLATASEMWNHLRQWYQPSSDALYLSVVH